MERELRRNQNIMIIFGTGVIAFGVWSILKAGFYFLLSRDEFMRMLELSPLEEDRYYIAYAGIVGFLLLDLVVRLYVGLSARAEGKGKKKGLFYVILCGFHTMSAIVLLVSSIVESVVSRESILDMVVALVVELTSLLTMVGLIRACLQTKKLSRQLSESE